MEKKVFDFSSDANVTTLINLKSTLGTRLLIGEGDTHGLIRKKQYDHYDVFLCWPKSSPHEYNSLEENSEIISRFPEKVIVCLDLNNKKHVQTFCDIFSGHFNKVKLDMDAERMELASIEKILSTGGIYQPAHTGPTTVMLPHLINEISRIVKRFNFDTVVSTMYFNPEFNLHANVKYVFMNVDGIDTEQLSLICNHLITFIIQLSSNSKFELDDVEYSDKPLKEIEYLLGIVNMLIVNFFRKTKLIRESEGEKSYLKV